MWIARLASLKNMRRQPYYPVVVITYSLSYFRYYRWFFLLVFRLRLYSNNNNCTTHTLICLYLELRDLTPQFRLGFQLFKLINLELLPLRLFLFYFFHLVEFLSQLAQLFLNGVQTGAGTGRCCCRCCLWC